eukprot:235209-Prorocentrum_minimum.AAC.1
MLKQTGHQKARGEVGGGKGAYSSESPVRSPSSVGILSVRVLSRKYLLGGGRRAADRREQREGV